ncbi:tryptophan--tRNA ligase [Micromonospora sp. NPDC020750]|uniref:tryptophan--tRNA ligase n=1 Tax=unclassified Micromonospora TaxID=2617518 RepID=UPI0037942C53
MTEAPNAPLAAAIARNPALVREISEHPERFRMLTGERPTGRLHVGHYFGTLQNRLRLQDLGVELFVLLADYQVFTDRDISAEIGQNVLECMADYLAIGLDPERCTIFAHSYVPELNQLMLPFLSLVSVSELQRNPTVKEEIRSSNRPQVNGLMFTYPVHQAADILFCKGNLVPGGKDQLPHVEVTRDIARRFNERFGAGEAYFPEPEILLSNAPLLLGVDGKKMGKSLNNSINLGATAEQTAKLIKGAKTDSIREVTYDPDQRPEVSNLVLLGSLAAGQSPEEFAAACADSGGAGLKKAVTEAVNEFFRPIRERRSALLTDPGHLMSVLKTGNEHASGIARQTLTDVRRLMGTDYYPLGNA